MVALVADTFVRPASVIAVVLAVGVAAERLEPLAVFVVPADRLVVVVPVALAVFVVLVPVVNE